MRARLAALLATAAALGVLAAASGAPAATPPSPWDGTNPFQCELQHAGLGATVPHPGADPFCIDFDKRHQTVSDLGVVDFLSKEPARVALASSKCFYFQSDHWRGYLVAGVPSTQTYAWDGHYYFDKARGDGGVWVTNFSLNGRTADPSQLPGFPAQYGRYFGPGTGGLITHDQVQADPSCVAKAKRGGQHIYAGAQPASRCVSAGGSVDRRHLGPVALGDREASVRRRLGPPHQIRRGFLHWCARGGGDLRAGERQDRSGDLGTGDHERMVVVLATARRWTFDGVRPGARNVWPGTQPLMHYDDLTVYAHRGVLAGVRAHHVRYLAVFDGHVIKSRSSLRTFLRRAR
jgi:hypothetical protein